MTFKIATEISFGDQINYRGKRALVMRAWKDGVGAPKGIPEPVGLDLAYVDDHGDNQLVRMVWPSFNAQEKSLLKQSRWVGLNEDGSQALIQITDEQKAKIIQARLEQELKSTLVELMDL